MKALFSRGSTRCCTQDMMECLRFIREGDHAHGENIVQALSLDHCGF